MSAQRPVRSMVESVLGIPWGLSLTLLLVLFVTRSNFVAENLHFASGLRAPDATLAVFFLAGLWIASFRLVGILLIAAALADQAAFASGVSSWCVTAAYVFLIPTYGVMWYGGRLCRETNFLSAAGGIKLLGTLLGSTALTWVISSGSFFFFSGYYTDKTLGYYLGHPAVYGHVPQYMGWAITYSLIGVAAAMLLKSLRRQSPPATGH